MKKFLSVLIVAAGLLVAGTNNLQAQGKIGYIDVNELIGSMPEAKKADTMLQQYQQALVQSANDKQSALAQAIEKFNTDSTKMSQAVKDVKRKEFQEKISELSGEEQKIQNELERKRQELAGPIQKKALDAIKDVAKDNGYNYVLPKEALLVAPPADDIMPLVKKKLGIK
jgi:outer membrane protein